MAKSQNSFIKNEKEKRRSKKKQEKQIKKEERKANPQGSELEDMLVFVDENGNLTSVQPDPTKKIEIDPDTIEVGVTRRTEDEGPSVFTGRVEFFNDSKGFGFIKEERTKEKYFVHINGLIDTIKENDKVSFELERRMKGMNAVKVKKI